MAVKLTSEEYISELHNPRHQELARMILDGATMTEMNARGFNSVIVKEMRVDMDAKIDGKYRPACLACANPRKDEDQAPAQEGTEAAQSDADTEAEQTAAATTQEAQDGAQAASENVLGSDQVDPAEVTDATATDDDGAVNAPDIEADASADTQAAATAAKKATKKTAKKTAKKAAKKTARKAS